MVESVTHIIVTLEDELLHKAKRLAVRKGVDLNTIINNALERELAEQEVLRSKIKQILNFDDLLQVYDQTRSPLTHKG